MAEPPLLPDASREVASRAFCDLWASPPGLLGSLSVVNNQPLGKRFMITAFVFFLIGGFLALLMRIQLTVPNNTFLHPDVYNQLFTMHGSTMMYLFAVPFLEGLAIYLMPLMIGSRDLAYPRLTAFGYWMYLFGGLIFYASFVVGTVPDVGWFAYTPLSGPRYAGLGTDFFLMGLMLVEIAGITAAIEIVVTILKLRAPGMSIGRLPILAWAFLTVSIMIIFAFTTLLTATLLLEMDRAFGTAFFDPGRGGSSLLWQHLFWFFGHPEVYIIFLPATGIVTMVVTALAGRLAGYTLIATAIIVTGFISFGLWVHHMYTTGLPELSMQFFAAGSLMIAIASGVQVFAWIASLWGTRPELKTPLLFVLGFLFIFVLGGLTGVMIAVVPFNWQVHDTYFIVAHFHYVLIGGAVFPIFAGLHYWIPKFTGRMLGEAMGKWSFWLTFIGFNTTFFPMHIMGFEGLPRRVYTYSAELGLGPLNVLATIGSFMLAAGFFMLVINLALSLRRGVPAPANPWHGDSLEWSIPSPPPIYAFVRPPLVQGRHALWGPNPAGAHGSPAVERARTALTSAPEEWRATLVTDALTAAPQGILHLPGPSFLPLWTALAILVSAVGMLLQAYLLSLFGLAVAAGLVVRWVLPRDDETDMLRDSEVPRRADLPVFTSGTRSVAWWGTVCLLATLGTVAATLLYSYFYLRLYADRWPQDEIERPSLLLPAMVLGVLLAGTAAQILARRALRREETGAAQLGLAGAVAAGVLFIGLQMSSLLRLEFAPVANAYASVFYTMHGVFSLFVLPGIGLSTALLAQLLREREDPPALRTLHMQVAMLYWYFLAAVGIVFYLTLHASPYLI